MTTDNYIYIVLALAALLLVSFLIPLYAFLRRRWKGLLLGGCLFQPLMLVVSVLMTYLFTYFYDRHFIRTCRETAMVTLRETEVMETDTLSHLWYLKPDEECFYEMVISGKDDNYTDADEVYDVVFRDSVSVAVEDLIVVTFDRQNRTVSATNDDQPIEVVGVNWDRVEEYFRQHR